MMKRLKHPLTVMICITMIKYLHILHWVNAIRYFLLSVGEKYTKPIVILHGIAAYPFKQNIGPYTRQCMFEYPLYIKPF